MNRKAVSDWDWIGKEEVTGDFSDVAVNSFNLMDGYYGRTMYTGAIRYKEASDFLVRCFDSFRMRKDLPLSDSHKIVDQIIELIFESPASILWLTKTKKPSVYLYEHPVSVCILSLCIGRLMNIPRHDLESLGISALLFDIGNVSIPRNLFESRDKYTGEDIDLVRDHTRLGRKILEGRMDVYAGASEVAYHHHERLDGSGYPLGVKANQLSLFTRIVSVADVYDAMTSDRYHMSSLIPADVLLHLKKGAGVQFDPDVVSALNAIVNVYRY